MTPSQYSLVQASNVSLLRSAPSQCHVHTHTHFTGCDVNADTQQVLMESVPLLQSPGGG